VPPFTVTYDYLCPFARNIHLHLLAGLRAGAPWDVTFAPFSLHQVHLDEGAAPVWEDPEYDDRIMALAASVSVRDRQPDRFAAAHEALFRARHDDGRRLAGAEDVEAALGAAGVDLDDVRADLASRRPHRVLAETHAQLARAEVFGVPTFLVGGDAVFVRYMTSGGDDDSASVKVIDSILSLISGDPELNEFKHTTVPA
jgi:DSBA-like thioredoxin domain-containing protein